MIVLRYIEYQKVTLVILFINLENTYISAPPIDYISQNPTMTSTKRKFQFTVKGVKS